MLVDINLNTLKTKTLNKGDYMNKNKTVDVDTHMKILNFLLHLQSKGLINDSQRVYYSMYIQDYLKEKEDNIKFMEELLGGNKYE